jgi:hypothetical protein
MRWSPLALALVALVALTIASHPRAALPAVVLCGLLHVARYTRFAVVLLAVLMVATLAGVRVDAAPPAPVGVAR